MACFKCQDRTSTEVECEHEILSRMCARITTLEADNRKRQTEWQAEIDSQYATLDAKTSTITTLEASLRDYKTDRETLIVDSLALRNDKMRLWEKKTTLEAENEKLRRLGRELIYQSNKHDLEPNPEKTYAKRDLFNEIESQEHAGASSDEG